MGLREGKPIIYVPVCKDPRDFMFVFGPLGYERVKRIGKCPLLISKPMKGESDGRDNVEERSLAR
jgi:hypothetical protein